MESKEISYNIDKKNNRYFILIENKKYNLFEKNKKGDMLGVSELFKYLLEQQLKNKSSIKFIFSGNKEKTAIFNAITHYMQVLSEEIDDAYENYKDKEIFNNNAIDD